MSEYSAEQISAAALGIANEMIPVLSGRPTPAVLTALSMHLGFIAGSAEAPDLDRLMQVVKECAAVEMQRVLNERAEG